jgi:hypothetical protein
MPLVVRSLKRLAGLEGQALEERDLGGCRQTTDERYRPCYLIRTLIRPIRAQV